MSDSPWTDEDVVAAVAAQPVCHMETMSDGYGSLIVHSDEEGAHRVLAALAPRVAALVAEAERRGAVQALREAAVINGTYSGVLYLTPLNVVDWLNRRADEIERGA